MLRRQVSKQDLAMADDKTSSSSSFSGASTPLDTPQEVVFSITPSNSSEDENSSSRNASNKKEKAKKKSVDRRDSQSLLQHIRLPQQLQVPSQGLK